MRPNGTSIQVYLVDGIANGLKTAEIMGWSGHMISAPRTELPKLLARQEMTKTGIYILSGTDPNNPDKEKVYIGESDCVGKRLRQHDAKDTKEFWEDTLAVVSKDNNLTKSHVRYLEARMIEMARATRRATVDNDNCPSPSNFLPEAGEAYMKSFLSQILMLLPVLGLNFVTSVPVVPIRVIAPQLAAINGVGNQIVVTTQQSSPQFELHVNEVSASGQQVSPSFFVLKNSVAAKDAAPGFVRHPYFRLRNQLISDGKFVLNEEGSLLSATEDIPFKSPSAAAAVVCGRAANGPMEWKVVGTGQTYREWQNSQFPPDDNTVLADDGGDE